MAKIKYLFAMYLLSAELVSKKEYANIRKCKAVTPRVAHMSYCSYLQYANMGEKLLLSIADINQEGAEVKDQNGDTGFVCF